ncbi:MAG: hypothetical protein ABIQ10_02990 [Gemmatimonadaceae bacterium]
MYRIRWTALLAMMAIAGARRLGAQTVRYGVMGDSVTAQLRALWTEDSTQNERAYCVQRARISSRPVLGGGTDSIFRVLAVKPADVTSQDPNHAEFECADGTPELHTHPPATCLTDDPSSCRADGPLAFSCQPSRSDYMELLARGDEYGIIQCDRRAFRFYYPSEYATSPPKARTSASTP